VGAVGETHGGGSTPPSATCRDATRRSRATPSGPGPVVGTADSGLHPEQVTLRSVRGPPRVLLPRNSVTNQLLAVTDIAAFAAFARPPNPVSHFGFRTSDFRTQISDL
jgi:hypothetical protein